MKSARIGIPSLLFILLGILIQWSCRQPIQCDLLLKNAEVFDGQDDIGRCDLCIRDGRIADLWTIHDQPHPRIESQQSIDLQASFLMPGLIEGHGHFLSYGESLMQLDLSVYKTYEAMIIAIRHAADTIESGTWIIGRGWHQEKWSGDHSLWIDGWPHHQALSEAVPLHPVYLTHASGHAALVNRAAMVKAGISKETKVPDGGRLPLDLQGRPLGILEENAIDLVHSIIPSIQDDTLRMAQAIELAGDACHRSGITSFHDAGQSIATTRYYRSLAMQRKLPVRIYTMLLDDVDSIRGFVQHYPTDEKIDAWLTYRATKTFYDGALGSRGAWLLAPYHDAPDYYGQNLMTTEDLTAYAQLCQENGLQFCIHAIGDRANHMALDLIEAQGLAGTRARIEHSQHLSPVDIQRFKELGVIASMQPIHCTSDAPYVIERLGRLRAQSGAYVWRSLIDTGAHLAIGTDVPVEPLQPFHNMYAALTRKSDPTSTPFYPDQSMTRLEVLRGYTSWNAYASFDEKKKGRIMVGYLADLCVLDRHLLNCTDSALRNTEVLMTIIDGQIVFDKLNE